MLGAFGWGADAAARKGGGPVIGRRFSFVGPVVRTVRSAVRTAAGPEAPASSAEEEKRVTPTNHIAVMPMWWQKSDQTTSSAHQDAEIYRLLRWAPTIKAGRGGGFRKLLIKRKQEYLLLKGDQAGSNAVKAEQENAPPGTGTKRFWGVWAAAAERVSEYWLAEQQSNRADFLHKLRDQGKIGLANHRENLCSKSEEAWWLLWLEWESLWECCPPQNDVITWNIGPQGVDLSFPSSPKHYQKEQRWSCSKKYPFTQKKEEE